MEDDTTGATSDTPRPPLSTIALEWTRIGCTGFGGPPAHIALLRRLCVVRRRWLTPSEFEDAIAATGLLPGPASTQLAIFCAWRLGGTPGALIGGACFIVPGLVVILALAALFLGGHPPLWVRGAASGAGAAVPAVALQAAMSLLPASWKRAGDDRTGPRARWATYLALGAAAAALIGPWLALVLFGCGALEVAAAGASPGRFPRFRGMLAPLFGAKLAAGGVASSVMAAGGLGALVWVAVKVGLLSYGGGFVIVPLMQHDAVHTYHWMTGTQFLTAVALGQVTPGPVVQTVSVVGYAAAGLGGGLLAALVAFFPSFAFVLFGGRYFARFRSSRSCQTFLTGAGAAAIGAIAGSTIPLALELKHLWQGGTLILAAIWLVALKRGAVPALLGAGLLGALAGLAGAPLTH